MKQIKNCRIIYNVHSLYKSYAASENGHIINIYDKVTLNGYYHDGFLYGDVESLFPPTIPVKIHKFVWECFNCLIPKDSVIEHIDKNKGNNKISNLRLVSLVPEYHDFDMIIEDIYINEDKINEDINMIKDEITTIKDNISIIRLELSKNKM